MELVKPVEGGIITQRFGENAGEYKVFGLAGHNGLDFGVPEGTAVRAAAAGRVARVSMDGSGYGLHARIEHKGEALTLYGHLSSVIVKQGQDVKAGEVIGYSGNTGNSTGPHLHFELRQPGGPDGFGGAVDPWPMLFAVEKILYQVKVLPREGVNLRSTPGLGGEIIGGAVRDSVLDVYEESGAWVRVGLNAWACCVIDNNFLLLRVGEAERVSWTEAIDRWARGKGFDGPRP